jgi:hypothetical protein
MEKSQSISRLRFEPSLSRIRIIKSPSILFIFLMELWEVESILGPRGTATMYWPIVPVPGDCEDGEVGGMKYGWQGKPKYLSRRHFVHHKSHLPDPGANPGRRGAKPATNRFSYGAAKSLHYTGPLGQ